MLGCHETTSEEGVQKFYTNDISQRAKKVLSDSPGLVDFAIGLVNSVLTCPTG